MIRLVRSMSRPRLAGAAAVLAAISLASACSKSSSNAANQTPQPSASSGSSSSSSAAPNAVLDQVYKGTMTAPSSASRPAVKGKSIWIISGGQSSESSSVPVNAAADAARKIGWSVHIYDTQLNPANAPTGVSQAIAAHADGIIVDGDCALARSPLEQAKAKNIVVVPIYGYDCNDAYSGKSNERLFTGYTNYGPAANKNLAAFAESYGFAQGQAVIAATNGKAQALVFNDPESTVVHYLTVGFERALSQCSGCKLVQQVDFNGLQLGPQLQQIAAAAILRHPEVNAIKSAFAAATLLSIAPAVQQSGRAGSIYVMGGEGFKDELDLLRNHQGVNAVMISPSDWTGWSAVDTMNSLFRGEKPAFSGLGWQLVDATHNLPATGAWPSPVDFKAVYEKAWGVG
jgi:ribose transport system substrate-binding protein